MNFTDITNRQVHREEVERGWYHTHQDTVLVVGAGVDRFVRKQVREAMRTPSDGNNPVQSVRRWCRDKTDE